MSKLQKNNLKRLTREKTILCNAIKLNCYQCQGYLTDGFSDCDLYRCPLYPFRLNRGSAISKRFQSLSKTLKQTNLPNKHVDSGYWKKIYEK